MRLKDIITNPNNKEKIVRKNISIPLELYKKLEKMEIDNDTTFSKLIRNILEDYIEKNS